MCHNFFIDAKRLYVNNFFVATEDLLNGPKLLKLHVGIVAKSSLRHQIVCCSPSIEAIWWSRQ